MYFKLDDNEIRRTRVLLITVSSNYKIKKIYNNSVLKLVKDFNFIIFTMYISNIKIKIFTTLR